jgi:hypothetical protein
MSFIIRYAVKGLVAIIKAMGFMGGVTVAASKKATAIAVDTYENSKAAVRQETSNGLVNTMAQSYRAGKAVKVALPDIKALVADEDQSNS